MKKNILIFIVFSALSQNLPAQNPVLWWKMEDSTANLAKESMTNKDFVISNNRSKPEVIAGVSGKALRLNGFLTWIEGATPVNFSSTEFTLSVWLALESYPIATAGVFSNLDNSSKTGLALLVNKYGQISSSVAVNHAIANTPATVTALEKFKWGHLVLSVDARAQSAKIYLNGALISNTLIPAGNISWQDTSKFCIGKSTIESLTGIFNTNAINAAIDEVKIFNAAFTDAQAAALFQAEKTGAIPDLSIPESRFAGDIHRPKYHAMPAAAWTNEPHGLIFQNGLWNLFFQKNANGPFWGNLNWGHLTSRNLISWSEQKPVLTPKESYDKEGCWSGTIVLDDKGAPTIYYTGVDGVAAHLCLAIGAADMSAFQKAPYNPIIAGPPADQSYRDFRDPTIWKENGFWYMLVGSGVNSAGSGGAVILYKSADLQNWNYIRLLKTGHPAFDNAGIFWEMPLFIKFPDNRRLLLVNKVPEGPIPARMLYWTGSFQDDRFTSSSEIPKQLEQDFGHLSPSVATDANGRIIAMGIIPDNVDAQFQKAKGYAHTYSLPREWSLSADGALKQKPIAELQRLRGRNFNYRNLATDSAQNAVLSEPKGRQIEIRAKIVARSATKTGIEVAKSADGAEKTRIYYDFTAGSLTVDRSASSSSPLVPRSQLAIPYSANQGDTLDLHIFLDGSVLEVFLNEEIVISTRIFPSGEQSLGVNAFSQGGPATFLNLDIWEMKNMNDPSVGTVETGKQIEQSTLAVFPNPAGDQLSVVFDNETPRFCSFSINNCLGREVENFSRFFAGTGMQRLDSSISGLPAGFYILNVTSENRLLSSAKFFKN